MEEDKEATMELTAASPFGCPNKNVQHETDSLKELHGSMEKPLELREKRIKKYVAWEYEEIGRVVGPFNRCFQQLFKSKDLSKSVDRLVVRDIKGSHHVFYFDISEPMNEDRVLMEKAWEDMQAGRPVDPERKVFLDKAVELQKRSSRR